MINTIKVKACLIFGIADIIILQTDKTNRYNIQTELIRK
jgi:hypothetical protein